MPSSLRGWALLDALLALGLWSWLGLSLVWQTRALLQQYRLLAQQTVAGEYQADLFETLRLARATAPMGLGWGERMAGPDCVRIECDATAWRQSLLADWQQRLGRELPQGQTWLAPWSGDARIQAVAVRWPEAGAPARDMGVNGQICPEGWRCLVALGWP
ncbi:MAG: hypothetical protein QM527_08155 [Alphaproteobacteria bacterium]|nr:hypothetical protein [Alphaproteobacteria bacterium]